MVDEVIVLAKRPIAGRVKTRLTPAFSGREAARLAAAALTDTLDAVDGLAPRRRILAFDGDPSGWLRTGWTCRRQRPGGLDDRIAHALSAATGPALLVGMDTPQLTPALLAAFDATRVDAALGLTADGGYWALGLREPRLAVALVSGVPMSTAHTGAHQLARLHDSGLRAQLLPELVDVDTAPDAALVAELAPHTRFAAEHARLTIAVRAS